MKVDLSRRSLLVGAPAIAAYSSLMPVRAYAYNEPSVYFQLLYRDEIPVMGIGHIQGVMGTLPASTFRKVLKMRPLRDAKWGFHPGAGLAPFAWNMTRTKFTKFLSYVPQTDEIRYETMDL